MPTYEYACRACGHKFEEIQKISDPKIEVCPKCGAHEAQRLISQGNFILKGGGWYTTGGYGTKSTPSEDSGVATGGVKKPETKSDGKSESKSDSKSESKSEGTSTSSDSSSSTSSGSDSGSTPSST